MESCGCKGQRYCLLCNKESNNLNTIKKLRKFIYCNLCGDKAFKTEFNHYNHLNINLIEYEDFIKIDGICIFEDVINEEEENQLIKRMDQDEWLKSQSGRSKQDYGSHITPHYDDFYFWGRILTLNLLSSTKLILTKDQSINTNLNDIEIIINLNRRCFLILDNESRYEWLHEIRSEHINNRRLAITYRELSHQHLPGNPLFNNKIDELLNLALNRI